MTMKKSIMLEMKVYEKLLEEKNQIIKQSGKSPSFSEIISKRLE